MLLTFRLAALGTLASLLLLVGCADRTALLVRVTSSDLAVPTDVDRLEISVRGDATGATLDRSFDVNTAWPHSLSLRPGAVESGGVRVTVTARHAGVFVTRRVLHATFARGEGRVVEVLLERSCAGIECPSGSDCSAGRCEVPIMDAGSDASVPDVGPRDGGVDAGNDADNDATLCRVGEVFCDGGCLDPQTDEARCGVAADCSGGAVCGLGELCTAGVCALSCPLGQLPCGGRCIDPSSDTTFCGAGADCVATPCATGNVCAGGTCATSCPGGQIACGGRCIDPLGDPLLCGAAADCSGGTACGGGTVCVAGRCAASCPGTQIVCGGRCIEPATDRNFCGAALDCSGGATCVSGQVCSAGVCTTSCPIGQTACGGRCVDTSTDRNFCGARPDCRGGAVCASGQVCASGVCNTSCPSGQIACAGRCIDPATDRVYCGASGMCAGGVACGDSQLCAGGSCVCVAPLVDCGGNCVDTRFEPEHCGGCERPCARTSACVSGRCVALAAGNFTGGFGERWDEVSFAEMRNLQEYIPATQPFMYASFGADFAAYDIASNRWSMRASAPTDLRSHRSMTLLDGRIWQLSETGSLVGYNIAMREWDIRWDVRGLPSVGMTINAGGVIWAAFAEGLQRIDPITGDAREIGGVGTFDTPRIAHHPLGNRIYFGGYRDGRLTPFDLTRERFEARIELPIRIGWAMCSDQDGHIYIGDGEDNATIHQFDIASGRLTALPRIEIIATEGDETVGCAVSEAGYLLVKSRQHMFRMDLEIL